MSYVKSNINVFGGFARDYTVAELETMTAEQFAELPLADQVNVYNNHRDQYDRLVADTAPSSAKDTRTDAQRFADEFEERIDTILRKNFHPNEA
jgi:hypothetical protein